MTFWTVRSAAWSGKYKQAEVAVAQVGGRMEVVEHHEAQGSLLPHRWVVE